MSNSCSAGRGKKIVAVFFNFDVESWYIYTNLLSVILKPNRIFFFAAESLPSPSPSYPPPPVPTTARRIAPLRRPSPGQSDSSTRFLFFCHGNFAHNEIQFCRHIDARESQYIANSVAVFKRSFSKQSHQFCRL